MQEPVVSPAIPELKELVAEASRALAGLDTARLDEMALSCRALNREFKPLSASQRHEMARQAREAAPGMAVFARVLEATRANCNVMTRLRELRMGTLEYNERQARGGASAEAIDGDH